MTVNELIYNYYSKHPNGHYFDYDTLKFFGECRSKMRVLKDIITVTDVCGNQHKCYVLSKYSRKYPGGGRTTYAYFDINTFNDVIVI